MNTAILPKFLKPQQSDRLIRIGRNFDGGYLIDERDLDKTRLLISLGVNEDWSFEKQFTARHRIPLYAYDATLNLKYLVRRAWRSILRLNPIYIARSLSALLDYPIFFSGRNKHIPKYVGLRTAGYTTLTAVIEEVTKATDVDNGIFLKIDIEGWEYRLLDEVVAIADKVTGLAIELHDVDLHLDKLEKFIEAFPLKLVHLHVNNYSPINANSIPLAIECTFTSSPASERTETKLPHPLDMPNKRNREEYMTAFLE
jgi:hypothetical protein